MGRRSRVALGVLCAIVVAAVLAASGEAGRPVTKLVIGKPVATPTHALSSKRLSVAFRVTRGARTAVKAAKVTATATVGGKRVKAGAAFRSGKAVVSYAIPADAMGKKTTVKVTVASGGSTASRVATFPIRRGQPLHTLSIADASVAEGNSGTSALTFTVMLSGPDVQPVSVDYATVDGSAVAPGDYTAANGTLTFAPGQTTQTITVQVVGDTAVETDEGLTVTLSNPVTATIAHGSALGTIANDDFPPHSGHYSGKTSQGSALSFDVSSDLSSVSNFKFDIGDWRCNSGDLGDAEITLGGKVASLGSDWGYHFDIMFPVNNGTASIEVEASGKLTQPGNGGGTVEVRYQANNANDVPFECDAGPVNWSAAGP